MTTSTPHIFLAGAGQLGSRHLQGLARLSFSAKVTVFDPLESSLDTARNRFEEIKQNLVVAEFTSAFPKDLTLDVGIIATNSDVRSAVTQQLLTQNKVSFLILEKFLFQTKDEYAHIEELLDKYNVKAWVNCPRRMYPMYEELKTLLSAQEHLHFSVSSSQMNLGSNSIHYLDLFSFLAGESIEEVTGKLDKEIIQSKRPGFIEFTGHLYGHSPKMSFDLHSYDRGTVDDLIIIQSPEYRILIREGARSMNIFAEKQWQERTITLPYQSELTNIVCEEMLKTGTCRLPSYKESAVLHLQILNQFLTHLQTINQSETLICPVS